MTGGLQKLTWAQVRDDAQRVNPTLAAVIDTLNPDDKHWFIRQRYPYGSLVMQQALLHLYNDKGKLVPITDDSIPKEIQDGIGYNDFSNPVCLVTGGAFEIYYL